MPAVAKGLETGSPDQLELEMVRADGTTFWTMTRGEALRGSDGAIVAVQGTVHDIDERKRAEKNLRLHGAALNAASHAMLITDRNGAIEWVNRAFTALTGYTAADAVGRNTRELLSLHDEALSTGLWITIQGGQGWRGAVTAHRKDGSVYPEDLTITPVTNADGEVTNFIAIKRDLTDERQLQAQFLQSQKMEVVGRLAGGIAHDFNNLLTVINGTTELMSMDLKTGDPLRADLDEIHRAGQRAAALTRQLLAFSRKQVMKPEALRLTVLLENMRNMLQRVLGEDITLVVTANGAGVVMADPGQLEQVIMNLAVNARDAMPAGGSLTIDVQDFDADGTYAAEHPNVPTGPCVHVAVSDTGTGMDEVTRRQIFEPFFTTKEPGKGTGLGLATVHGIVRQTGGTILVDSEIGRGTTFDIFLPCVETVAQSDHGVPVTTATAACTETILVVEDEDAVRHLTTRMLESFGYTVLSASNGGEALLLLERHEADVHLMITDVVMPLMSGPDLAARLAAIRPQMRVLFTSGHTDNAVLRRSALDQAAHFIAKPYTTTDLRRGILDALDHADAAAATPQRFPERRRRT